MSDVNTPAVGTAAVLFAASGWPLLQWLPLLPSAFMGLGALAGGVASLLPALTGFLNEREERRQRAEEFRRRALATGEERAG